MSKKPSIPKGTRDFSPQVMVKRNYIFDTIKSYFSKYGYQQIETPAMEKLSTLTGKYGEEGDRLIFKILPRGEKKNSFYREIVQDQRGEIENNYLEEALRYDLTVPFARYVVQYQNDITFPFKRFQVQPVWRADRPQKGRYREFYQCDADAVGSDSLLYEVELIQLFDDVLTDLGIPGVSIKINNRKILTGIVEIAGESDKLIDITVAIDKLDKIGREGVINELKERGLKQGTIDKITPLFDLGGDTQEKLGKMETFLQGSETGLKGIEELRFIVATVKELGLRSAQLVFDTTLARGLNYYTGAIFEVTVDDTGIGSICGGGRYDNLTGSFGKEGLSGVGISFGADRIYDVMETLKLFPDFSGVSTRVLILNFGEKEQQYGIKLLKQLRNAGINAEIYPAAVKLKKQMGYANDKQIPFVILLGEKELETGKLAVKEMESGKQENLDIEEIIKKIGD